MSTKNTQESAQHEVATGTQKPDSGNQLHDYEQVKFELAGLIREADAEAWKQTDEKLQRELRLVLRKLAEDGFYLTLAGQFNRGKTTLLNALVGMDRLPTGIVPITSVITAVSYNSRERVMVHFADSTLSQEVSLDELPEWITEQGNPGNRKKIDMAEVQLPAEILRRGSFFVDTPGLGSAVVENTETTRRFLPQVDALVLVTSFEFPLSSEELNFLRSARSLRRKVFVVINKLDLCSPGQRANVLDFIGSRVAEATDWEDVPLFPVSASKALIAKLQHDREGLDHSGLPAFEQALVSYLIGEKSQDFLVSTCDRIESLLECLRTPAAGELRRRLDDIRAGVLHPISPGAKNFQSLPTPEDTAIADQALRISPCVICKRMAEETFKFVSRYQYELFHSKEQQALHASRTGFCDLHTRDYARLASPQGISSGYPSTVASVAEHLRNLLYQGRLGDDWEAFFRKFLPSQDRCPVCEVVLKLEQESIDHLIRTHAHEKTESGDGLPCLCLAHLLGILGKAPAAAFANRVVLHMAAVFDRTAENLQRFALHHGGSHMELVTEEEARSPEIGLNLLVGQPNIMPSRYSK
jgi:GTP-binding protein EngB required for normal cell division